jgi:hypothetical protein
MKYSAQFIGTSIFYLLGLPILGCLAGYGMMKIGAALGNNVESYHYEVSVGVWALFFLYAGIQGFIGLRKIERLRMKDTKP